MTPRLLEFRRKRDHLGAELEPRDASRRMRISRRRRQYGAIAEYAYGIGTTGFSGLVEFMQSPPVFVVRMRRLPPVLDVTVEVGFDGAR